MSYGYKTHSDPGPAPGPGWLGAASEGKEPLKVKQNTIRGLSRARVSEVWMLGVRMLDVHSEL